jgi:hypothetical protein
LCHLDLSISTGQGGGRTAPRSSGGCGDGEVIMIILKCSTGVDNVTILVVQTHEYRDRYCVEGIARGTFVIKNERAKRNETA